jgi:Holliday junction resolvasome RuvABC endonuclease subunit
VWGIDPSTAALALGIHDGISYQTAAVGLPRHTDPLRRLAASLPVAQEWLERVAHERGQPSLVVIEQPAGTGHKVHPATWYATAMTAMATANAVECPIHMVGPPTWKMEALGKGSGHAKKGQVFTWARVQGWKGTSQDEADTVGIARCAYIRLAAHLRVAVS